MDCGLGLVNTKKEDQAVPGVPLGKTGGSGGNFPALMALQSGNLQINPLRRVA